MILDIARALLQQSLAPPARYQILRHVLGQDTDAPEVREAWDDLARSKHVADLSREQRPDGGWGRFHSRDSGRQQRFPTTEAAVARSLALGLDRDHALLSRAACHIAELLQGERPFPDPPERNDRWPTGQRLFLAATLARIWPEHPSVDAERALWLEILRRTFRSGAYDAEAERAAHVALTGASVAGSYLVLSGRYQLDLLGSRPGLIPDDLELALLRWLWTRPEGIGYLGVPLHDPPPGARAGPFERWFSSLELLARGCPAWSQVAAGAVDWLWRRKTSDDRWDFGPRWAGSWALPLAEDWRRPVSRQSDWTARTLLLLRHARVQP